MPLTGNEISVLLVVLVRHAEREFLSTLPDWDQPVTAKGRREAEILGEKLVPLVSTGLQAPGGRQNSGGVAVIFSSPYKRCKQTATIITSFIQPRSGVQFSKMLAPETEGLARWVLNLVSANLEAGCLFLVGHQPDLALISGQLGGTPLQLKTAEAAGLLLEAKNGFWQVGNARLLWRVRG